MTNRGVPRQNVLQDRFYSARDIKATLRRLDIGVDNAEFNRLWLEGVITPPLVYEAEYIAWNYDDAKRVIIEFYNLKGREQEYDTYKVDEVFIEIKELKRYKREMENKYYRKGLPAPY